jgi:hypothetical protein
VDDEYTPIKTVCDGCLANVTDAETDLVLIEGELLIICSTCALNHAAKEQPVVYVEDALL